MVKVETHISIAPARTRSSGVRSESSLRPLWGAYNGVIALRHQPVNLRASDEHLEQTLELAR